MTERPTLGKQGQLRVAMIGAGLMARSHTMAYKLLPILFPDTEVSPQLSILADVNEAAAKQGAQKLGYARWTNDWRTAVTDPDIDVVDIVTPNMLHFEVAMAAIAAGKHVYCEKPLATTAPEAKAMWQAARDAGVTTLVGYSYLGNPGVRFAKQLAQDGTLGEIWSIHAHFLVDANADPLLPRTWHYEHSKAGLGALGDIGSHVVSLVLALGGPITKVFADLSTVIKERPFVESAGSYGSNALPGAPLVEVENDDIATVLGKLTNGGTAVIEANRVSNGHPFDLGFEILGSKGSIRFNQQDSYKVDLFLRDQHGPSGTTTVTLGPGHPNYAAYWPFPGVPLGLHELKAVEIRNLFSAIHAGVDPESSFQDGWQVAEVLQAAETSGVTGTWINVPQ